MIKFHCHALCGKARGEITVGSGYVSFAGVLMTAQLTRENKELEIEIPAKGIHDIECTDREVALHMRDGGEHRFMPQYSEDQDWSTDALAAAIRSEMG